MWPSFPASGPLRQPGARATPLAAQIPGAHDAQGRVNEDPYLRTGPQWIYPPATNRQAVFAIANPDYVIVP